MIEVLKCGLLDLVMDCGRPGFRAQGVPAGGAADGPALVVANRRVGNPDQAAGLECLLKGPQLRFSAPVRIALAGAEAEIKVNNRVTASPADSLSLSAGDVLQIGPVQNGARVYLAIQGGLDVPEIMGSRSTFLPASFGGWQGRALHEGDRLGISALTENPNRAPGYKLKSSGCIRLLPGPQIAGFTDTALSALTSLPYRVTADANRIGIRLTGKRLVYQGKAIASQAVLPGAIQIPPDGQPILLGWDGPVTGGYPVIAGVIAADLHRLAQLRPGDEIRLGFVTRAQALAAWHKELFWLG